MSNIKMYSKATIIKTVRYWHKDKHREQQNRVQKQTHTLLPESILSKMGGILYHGIEMYYILIVVVTWYIPLSNLTDACTLYCAFKMDAFYYM